PDADLAGVGDVLAGIGAGPADVDVGDAAVIDGPFGVPATALGDRAAAEVERAVGAEASHDEPVVDRKGGGVLDVEGRFVAAVIRHPELAGAGDELSVAPEGHQVVFAALADGHVPAAVLVERAAGDVDRADGALAADDEPVVLVYG